MSRILLKLVLYTLIADSAVALWRAHAKRLAAEAKPEALQTWEAEGGGVVDHAA